LLYLKDNYFWAQYANITNNKLAHQRFAFSPRQFLFWNEFPTTGQWFYLVFSELSKLCWFLQFPYWGRSDNQLSCVDTYIYTLPRYNLEAAVPTETSWNFQYCTQYILRSIRMKNILETPDSYRNIMHQFCVSISPKHI